MLFLGKKDSFLAVMSMFSMSISLEALWLYKDRKLLSIPDLTKFQPVLEGRVLARSVY